MISSELREYIAFKRDLYEQFSGLGREMKSVGQENSTLDVPEEFKPNSISDVERNIERMIMYW